jgi:aromatic-L-amino-acid decarboxylase
MAQDFAGWVKADPRFELVVPPPLNLVCFRLKGTDAVNQRIMEDLNRAGQIYLTHTKLSGRFTLRMCVGQTMTQRPHVERAWALIQAAASNAAIAPG